MPNEAQSTTDLPEEVNHTNREHLLAAHSLQSTVDEQANLARDEPAQQTTLTSNEQQWYLTFQNLRAWMDEHAHEIPKRYAEDPSEHTLAKWVDNQRTSYKGKKRHPLERYQITLLESIRGWSWTVLRSPLQPDDYLLVLLPPPRFRATGKRPLDTHVVMHRRPQCK